MDLLETYDKNKEKHLLKEQSSGVVGGHFGRGGKQGKDVDDIFAGGYVATDSVKGDLTRQITSRKEKRKEMEDAIGKENVGIENPLGGYHDIETPALLATYDYLDAISVARHNFSKDMTPESDVQFKAIDKDYYFDEIIDDISDKKKFINNDNSMKFVDIDYYNKIKKDLHKKEKLDNEKKTKFVNDTNDWKMIYESKNVRRSNDV